LQPPRSPIASEGEESLEIESIEKRIARFDVETCAAFHLHQSLRVST
jgi:hypothetical protein